MCRCVDVQARAFEERGEEGMASLRAQPFASPARVKVRVFVLVRVLVYVLVCSCVYIFACAYARVCALLTKKRSDCVCV